MVKDRQFNTKIVYTHDSWIMIKKIPITRKSGHYFFFVNKKIVYMKLLHHFFLINTIY